MTRQNWAGSEDELPEDEHDAAVPEDRELDAPAITGAQDG